MQIYIVAFPSFVFRKKITFHSIDDSDALSGGTKINPCQYVRSRWVEVSREEVTFGLANDLYLPEDRTIVQI